MLRDYSWEMDCELFRWVAFCAIAFLVFVPSISDFLSKDYWTTMLLLALMVVGGAVMLVAIYALASFVAENVMRWFVNTRFGEDVNCSNGIIRILFGLLIIMAVCAIILLFTH